MEDKNGSATKPKISEPVGEIKNFSKCLNEYYSISKIPFTQAQGQFYVILKN